MLLYLYGTEEGYGVKYNDSDLPEKTVEKHVERLQKIATALGRTFYPFPVYFEPKKCDFTVNIGQRNFVVRWKKDMFFYIRGTDDLLVVTHRKKPLEEWNIFEHEIQENGLDQVIQHILDEFYTDTRGYELLKKTTEEYKDVRNGRLHIQTYERT